MKLNNQQVTVLAKSVLDKLEKKDKYTKEEVSLAKEYLKEIGKLEDQKELLDKRKESLDNKLHQKLGYTVYNYVHKGDSVDRVLQYKPNTNPQLDEIKNKIVLESIFETKESLQEFIDNLVKEYSK